MKPLAWIVDEDTGGETKESGCMYVWLSRKDAWATARCRLINIWKSTGCGDARGRRDEPARELFRCLDRSGKMGVAVI